VLTSAPEAIAVALTIERSREPLRHLSTKVPKEMAWLYVLLADLFEIAWPFVLKWSAPLSRWAPLFVVVICAILANYLLAEAVKHLPAATVYATFVGIGTAGTAIIGMVFFGESTNIGRVCSLVVILLGLIGLKLFSDEAE
jgi:quaternary ammonium compound-resistance protein SugE